VKAIDFSGVSGGGEGMAGARTTDARNQPWTRATAVTPDQAKTISANMMGTDLAKAVQAERQALLALQDVAKGFDPTVAEINRRLSQLGKEIKADRGRINSLSGDPELSSNEAVVSRTAVLRQSLAEKFVERTRLLQEKSVLEGTQGDRINRAQLEYDRAKRERERLEAAGALNRSGYGSELDQMTLQYNPESIPAMTLRQVDR